MRPAIVYGFVMNVVAALEMFAIPLLLGGPVGIQLITTFIYDKGFEAAGRIMVSSPPPLSFFSFWCRCSSPCSMCCSPAPIASSASGRRAAASSRSISAAGVGRLRRRAVLRPSDHRCAGLRASSAFLRHRAIALHLALRGADLRELPRNLMNGTYARSIVNTILLAVGGGFLGTLIIGALSFVAPALGIPLPPPGRSSGAAAARRAGTHRQPRCVLCHRPGAGLRLPRRYALGAGAGLYHPPSAGGYGIVAPASCR
jgi:iron(III) transport system permease protein